MSSGNNTLFTEFAVSDSEYADDTAIVRGDTFLQPSRCRKVHPVTHRTFSTLGSGGSRRILPPFQGFKDRIAILLSPSLNIPRPEHVRQHGYDRSNLAKWTFCTRGDQIQIPRLLYFKRWIRYNRCPITDRFCSSCLWSIIQMHIPISKH